MSKQVQDCVDADTVKGMEMFVGVSDEACAAISAAARVEELPSGRYVFEQGAQATRAFALARGSIRIIQTGRDGQQSLFRFIVPGEMFGSVPLFTDHVLPADAITVEDSIILSWTEKALFELIDSYPRIAINVVRIVGERLAEAQSRLREVSTQRADQRIALALLRLAAHYGHGQAQATTIDVPLRRKDIAEICGTTLHTASRIISGWEKEGIVARAQQTILIRDAKTLRAIAEQ